LRWSEADIRPDPSDRNIVGEAALSLYAAAGRIATPVAGAMLRLRSLRRKEDSARRRERFGVASHARPPGALVWVHAASVGETVAALPLVKRLASSGAAILLTTGTVTAAELARRRLPGPAIHQFVPIDTPSAVRRFLDHWRPDLALFMESELWPTTLRALSERSLPLVVVNARMSDRSFREWRAFLPLARAVVGRAELFLAQTATDAERLRQLGARLVAVCGNLKFDVPAPPVDSAKLARMRAGIAGRPVLVAASTHPGEENAVIAAHREIARRHPKLLTIIAPRHPERGDALVEEIGAAGLSVRRHSLDEQLAADTAVYLADTIGEMGLWYRLADVAFLGGSIAPRGGQNPIEPAKLMAPVVHGAHVTNFRDVYDALADADAVKAVRDGAALGGVVNLLLDDGQERQRLALAARACVERFTGSLDRTLDALQPYLACLRRSHAAASRA
jgi:3-deoxy-D-manno-octulosonic-acid transferase